jgi:dTDP-4-amino-4,6-dideoxygalactose transaminase
MIHYPIPPHKQRAYASSCLSLSCFSIAEQIAGECLSIPIFPQINIADVECICEQFKSIDFHLGD